MYPKKINPNPLVSSTIEIRFKTGIEHGSIFKLFFGKLSDTLQDFESTMLPRDLRIKNPELKFYPDYIFSNEDYSVSFNENFISFENITDYKLWENYSESFKNILSLILESDVIETIDRLGVRYQSKFNIEDFNMILKEVPSMKVGEFDESFVSYTTKIIAEGFDLLLQLKKDITTESISENEEKQGHLIDIDVSLSNNVEHEDIVSYIESAHSLLKKTFFGLLKNDFIETLNPEY